MIFLKINCQNFSRLVWRRHTKFSDWYGGRHTCHTASGATVPALIYGLECFSLPKKWFEIVGLCCHSFSYEIVQDIKYGNNIRMSALFWILPP